MVVVVVVVLAAAAAAAITHYIKLSVSDDCGRTEWCSRGRGRWVLPSSLTMSLASSTTPLLITHS